MSKVVHILTDTNIGGAGVWLKRTLQYIEKDFDITVLIPENSLLKDYLSTLTHCQIIEVPYIGDKSWSLKGVLALHKVLKKLQPEVVHTHASLSGRVAAKVIKNTWCLNSRHCIEPIDRRPVVRRLKNVVNSFLSDRIVAVSHGVYDNLVASGVSKNKLILVPNGVDPLVTYSQEHRDQIKADYAEESLPLGTELKYSGDVAGIEQNFGNLFQSLILAVFLVFIILTLQFKSITQPFIILTTLPMAFIGVIWGLVITGNEFGFYAFMGLVALIGIAVNDAIVLIDYINYLRSEGFELTEAIKEAGKTRFNPVLATTLTTISGVLPLAFKEVIYAQFSFALIFGLMVTTILTLIFIPTIYGLFTSRRKAVAQ